MSQSSTLEQQVKDINQAGFPVKTGIRGFRSSAGGADVKATDSWLHRWAKHAAQNYALVSTSRGVRFLRGACEGLPAVVIGIGPSLDLHHETLKGLKRKATLIATDAAYRPLLANGVIPDIVISFDCKREQSSLWEGMPTQGIPMLFNSCAHPDVIKSWAGPILFFNHWHTTDEFSEKLLPYIYPDIGQIASAGTVGNMALQLAMILGCKKIATVGMDMCYAKEGDGWRYRCRDYHWNDGDKREKGDSVLYNNSERVARSFLKAMGTIDDPDAKLADGSKEVAYRTDPELVIYAKSFLNIVEHFKKEVEVTHCSTWNIYGDRVKSGKLQDWATENCKRQFEDGRTTLWTLDKIIPVEPIVRVSTWG